MATIPRSILLTELRRYAVACEAEAQRARAVADAAWRQWRQALDDEAEDALLVGQQQWAARLAEARRVYQQALAVLR